MVRIAAIVPPLTLSGREAVTGEGEAVHGFEREKGWLATTL